MKQNYRVYTAMQANLKSKHIRSFVRRDSRETSSQAHARNNLWPLFGLSIKDGVLNNDLFFNRDAPLFLEIGFGSGLSLLNVAQLHPEKNFIGVETHKPGVGSLIQQIAHHQLTNLRLYQEDVVEVIEQCLIDESLSGVFIFFPDPWQKRRHHNRRLIQAEFVKKIVNKLCKGGIFHLATDWEDYAHHMMKVMTETSGLTNSSGEGKFALTRSPYRPIITKFEQRSIKEGRQRWELQFYVRNR